MDKSYEPGAIERRLYDEWEARGLFSPRGDGEPYSIVIPPPNVTGTLHMGHAFQETIMDALTRVHRMRGRRTLWQPGTDHAGIATQMLVERKLNAEGRTRHDVGREAFLERVWEWKAESGDTISRQLRRLGASPDWSRERFTMDAELSAAVTETFVRLHDDGLIYRGKRLVNWDPVLHTALSDLEVISEEEQGSLWHFRYPLADGSGQLVVATTRPETMLGDTAVAVHPGDERYAHLVGRHIVLPLVGREIPIVADDYVDPAFGTGCVKITPAHDFNDNELGKRHGLEVINVFTDDAAMNDAVPEAYRGLDRYAARKRVVADLEAANLVEKIEPHRLMVPRGDRSNAVVEPYLTDQWYVDLTREVQPDGRPGGLAAIVRPAIDVVTDGRVRFVPDNWSRTYLQWLENIQDWCISRQIWWGHRIPAWYDEAGNVYVGRDETEARERAGLDASTALVQDDDVLDTWFSSALWPYSTQGWPRETRDLKDFYPTSVLVTGFDIIFFWVARMVMFGLRFMENEVPFKDVYIHGLVRDATGAKMSKSKGNVLDPIDIIDGIELEPLVAKRTSNLMQERVAPAIEKQTRKEFPDGIPAYGTDALRYTFASLASNGRDIRFDLKRVEGYRNFCNKLWNATRFVLMNVPEPIDAALEASSDPVDRWIVSRLQQTEAAVSAHIDAYRFDLASAALYEFVWNEYCDWYLELVKPALAEGADPTRAAATRATLVRVLETTLRLLHPFMPFITEELWRTVAPRAGRGGDGVESISFAPWPVADPERIDEAALAELDWLKAAVMGVRRIRSEMDVSPAKRPVLYASGASAVDRARIDAYGQRLCSLARLESIEVLDTGDERPEAAVALVGELELLLPLAGLIDVGAELARLDKEIVRLEGETKRLGGKLGNEGFVSKAPAAVVEAERAKLDDAHRALAALNEQRARIATL